MVRELLRPWVKVPESFLGVRPAADSLSLEKWVIHLCKANPDLSCVVRSRYLSRWGWRCREKGFWLLTTRRPF
jgi:hypothetical protein